MRIYHFTTQEVLFRYILPKRQLKFNTFTNANDPLENNLLRGLADTTNKENLPYFSDWNKLVAKQADFYSQLENLRNKTKFISFSIDSKYGKGYSYPRMWAQYGDNHYGVCIEIESAELIKENKVLKKNSSFFRYGKVEYTKKIQFHNIDYLSVDNPFDYYIKNYKALFFRKLKNWSSEHEYRILMIDEGEEYFKLGNSLKSITFGWNTTPQFLSSLLINIPAYRIMINKKVDNFSRGRFKHICINSTLSVQFMDSED